MPIGLVDYLAVPGQPVTLIETAAQSSAFLSSLPQLAPWLTYRFEQDESARGARVQVVGGALLGVVKWRGEVVDRQREPLVELLRAASTSDIPWETPATPAELSQVKTPLEIQIYVGSDCPYCPALASICLRFAFASALVETRVIVADGEENAPVRSVPTVLVGHRRVWVGAGSEYPLLEAILES